jgi:hypothetical protein
MSVHAAAEECAACLPPLRRTHATLAFGFAELLEPPTDAPLTGKKALAAHRILVTARSLRSADSSAPPRSPSRASDVAGRSEGAAACAGRAVATVQQAKCLLLQALVEALPLLEICGKPQGACAYLPVSSSACTVSVLLPARRANMSLKQSCLLLLTLCLITCWRRLSAGTSCSHTGEGGCQPGRPLAVAYAGAGEKPGVAGPAAPLAEQSGSTSS